MDSWGIHRWLARTKQLAARYASAFAGWGNTSMESAAPDHEATSFDNVALWDEPDLDILGSALLVWRYDDYHGRGIR